MKELKSLKNYKKIHMIGIGGVSMSGLAEHLTHFGFLLTGSDKTENENTRHLKEIGIPVTIGSDTKKIKDADIIVYTAAIPDTDEELLEAKKQNKKIMERSEFLGLVTKCYEECICISGTHGKTTTTSMIATCFLEAKYDPTIEVGAKLKTINGNNRTGNSEYFILEACEFVDSFLQFYPKTEIILNIDDDHLDYFKTIENTKKSFQKFIERLPKDGLVIANIDDANTKEVIEKENALTLTYGIQENADFQAKNITLDTYGYPSFDCYKNGTFLESFTLNVHGTHNIYNALACIATCEFYKIPTTIIKESLKKFTGASRRFEKIGSYKGIPIFDDYAHHPTEIASTLQSSQSIPHKETWAIFEPHTYSRTEEHLKEFANILSKFDHILLAEIYAAREINTSGISSKDIAKLITPKNPNCQYFSNYEEIIDYLKTHVQKGDIIITIGAGTINQVGYQLVKEN